VQTIPEHSGREHVVHVQGHKVKVETAITAADCPIELKFRTAFHYRTAGTPQMFKVKGQGHGFEVQGHSVT